MTKLNFSIRIILSVLLFGCLLQLPYGYYQITRFSCFSGFAFLAYQSYESKEMNYTIIFACLSFLFQPFFKISLGRELWNIVDLIVGIALLLSIFQFSKVNKKNN